MRIEHINLLPGNRSKAFKALQALVDTGVEFPDAEFKVRERYKLSEKDWAEVLKAYDAIGAEGWNK
jgi:hypothetical protein